MCFCCMSCNSERVGGSELLLNHLLLQEKTKTEHEFDTGKAKESCQSSFLNHTDTQRQRATLQPHTETKGDASAKTYKADKPGVFAHFTLRAVSAGRRGELLSTERRSEFIYSLAHTVGLEYNVTMLLEHGGGSVYRSIRSKRAAINVKTTTGTGTTMKSEGINFFIFYFILFFLND